MTTAVIVIGWALFAMAGWVIAAGLFLLVWAVCHRKPRAKAGFTPEEAEFLAGKADMP